MEKMRNVLVVDPRTATVTEEVWNGDIQILYDWIRTDIVQLLRHPATGVQLYVDEEARMKVNQAKWFDPFVYPQPILGVGVILRNSKGYPSKDDLAKINWGLLFNPHGPMAGRA